MYFKYLVELFAFIIFVYTIEGCITEFKPLKDSVGFLC